jgi:uncharacterized membrane protein
VAHPLVGNLDWMVWNLVLATVPAALAAFLFRDAVRRNVAWWLGAAVFVAFLPNAPYVLTDVVHLPGDLGATEGSALATAAVLTQYAAFAAVGFGAYAFSILRLGAYLRSAGVAVRTAVGVELGLHMLAAVGIVLGRVFRFNSWDLIARPEEVLDVVIWPQRERTVAIVLFLVGSLAVGTMIVRAILAWARRPPYA